MATVVESTSSLSEGTRTNSTVTAPSGIADGDILVYALKIGGASGGPTATAPSGFAAWSGIPVAWDGSGISDTYGLRIYLWYKVASSESGNYTATHSSGDSEAFMWRISGGDTGTPNDQAATTHSTNGGGTEGDVIGPTSTQTPTVDGCCVIWVGVSWDNFGNASPSSGWTEDRNNAAAVFYAQHIIQGTAAATGSISVTSTQWITRPEGAAMVVVRASTAGGGRTTKNTRAFPLGMEIGMGWVMDNQV